MHDLKALFEEAVTNSKNLSERPSNANLLRMYALYKQATHGDNTDASPSSTDIVNSAKWEAWNGCKGMASEQAMQAYIDLVASLD